MVEQEIGHVMHYFGKAGVAAITLTADLAVGDTIHVKGATTNFTTKVESMQIEQSKVEKATSGQSVGIKVPDQARLNDKVFKVTE